MGFEPHNVFSRSGLLTASNLTLVERRGNLTEETEEDIAIKKLTPDQWCLLSYLITCNLIVCMSIYLSV
jgi:formate/nitrite transporter FocA (FNT family)